MIDVHAKPGSLNMCLDCGRGGWAQFVASMKEHHGINVPEKIRPMGDS